jgi:hypothetical protein
VPEQKHGWLYSYGKALAHRWWPPVVGLVGGGVVTTIDSVFGVSIDWTPLRFLWLVGAGLLVAQAWAWSDMRKERDKALHQRDEAIAHEGAIEERKAHREQIAKWRAMVARHLGPSDGYGYALLMPPEILSDEDFLSLRRLLPDDVKAMLQGIANAHPVGGAADVPGVTIQASLSGAGIEGHPILGPINDRIDELEAEWGLP